MRQPTEDEIPWAWTANEIRKLEGLPPLKGLNCEGTGNAPNNAA